MTNHFDLNLLRVLVALDGTRSVTRAAEQLEMSQSGFSTALARLRRQFDNELFVRTAQGMKPTARATEIVDTARTILDNVQSGILQMPVFDPSSATVEFRLSLADVAEVVFLPRLTSHLQQYAPSCSVRSESIPRDALADAMESGRIDLALGYFPDLEANGFYQQRLYTHTYACMVRRNHLAVETGMTKEIFVGQRHAVVMSPARTSDLFDRFLERKGIKRKVAVRTPHHLALPAIVSESDLIATVPMATAHYFATLGAVELLPLPFKPPIFGVQQHWHRRTHKDAASQWLRKQVAYLFNDGTDIWREAETQFYGSIRVGRGERIQMSRPNQT